MRDYHVLSLAGNPLEAEVTDHGVILDVDQVPWAEKQMWDNDVVEKNGRYYLIFSAKDYNGVFHLGVAVSERPEGPFIPQEHPIRGSFSIDPCVFKDDDGEIYCYFGGLWGGQLQSHRRPYERIFRKTRKSKFPFWTHVPLLWRPPLIQITITITNIIIYRPQRAY